MSGTFADVQNFIHALDEDANDCIWRAIICSIKL